MTYSHINTSTSSRTMSSAGWRRRSGIHKFTSMKKTVATFPDFDKLEIRVGEIKNAVAVENSKKLYELFVDLGEEYGTVTILTGMQAYYKPEDFIGKKFLFLANLAPRPMAGKVSNGMIMSGDEEGKPILIEVSTSLKNGLLIR